MKLRLQGIALLDLTKATEETLASIESIRNATMVLVGADKRALFQQAALYNVTNVDTVPEGATLAYVNGAHQMTATTPDASPVYLFVNGKLVLHRDISVEQLRRQLAGGMVNGKVICTETQLATLMSLGLRINGKSDAYPDGCDYRAERAPLSCNEAAVAERDIYLAQRVAVEAGALALLRQNGRKLFGKSGIVIPASEQGDLHAVWHGMGDVLIVPEGFHFSIGSLDINAVTSCQLRGKHFVNCSLTLQSSVEPRHLEALEAIHVTGEVILPVALLDAFLPKLVNEPDILPYEGILVENNTDMTVTEAMLTQSEQMLTLVNNASMTVEKTVSPALLREKVVQLINNAGLKLSSGQQAALMDRLQNNARIELSDDDKADKRAQEL
ncbi:MAG TPA: hypothetical protein PKE04_20295, partial [Clostridia bacterium]|nr:hypothetical protein [Clostridia bacterium]